MRPSLIHSLSPADYLYLAGFEQAAVIVREYGDEGGIPPGYRKRVEEFCTGEFLAGHLAGLDAAVGK